MTHVLFFAALAWGQTPETDAPAAPDPMAPARLCAEAAAGTELEVCLELAARHPDAVESILAALTGQVDRQSDADRALLAALLQLLDDDTGASGAAAMGALDDPRVIPPLIHTVTTRKLEVALVAVDALATLPQGHSALVGWIRDPFARLEVREASAKALARTETAEAGDALIDALRQPQMPPTLRKTLLVAIADHFPARVDEVDNQVSRDGTIWLTAAGALGLGTAMGATGYFGQTQLETLGSITGVIGGGTVGYLAGRAWPMEAGDAAFVTTNQALGTVGGALIGGALADGDAGGYWLGALAGDLAGLGTGLALRRVHPGTERDAIEATGVAVATTIMTEGLVRFATENDALSVYNTTAVAGGALLAGTALGHAIAPRIEMSGADHGLVGLGLVYGVTLGGLAPLSDRTFRAGLPETTGAFGALAGYAASGLIDPGWDTVQGAAGGAVAGGVFGGGVGLLISDDYQTHQALALAGTTAGLFGGGYLAYDNPDPIDDRDLVLVGLSTAWATWQTSGWIGYAEAFGTRADGVALIVPSAVGGTLAVLSPQIDVPVTHSSAAASIGLWGGYIGGVSAELTDQDLLLWSLVGSDVGLIGGSLAMGLADTPPLVIGIADAGGVLIGSTAALGAAMVTTDSDTILATSIVGAGLGFAGGAVLGHRIVLSGKTRNIALHTRPSRARPEWSVMPATFRGDDDQTLYGARLEVTRW